MTTPTVGSFHTVHTVRAAREITTIIYVGLTVFPGKSYHIIIKDIFKTSCFVVGIDIMITLHRCFVNTIILITFVLQTWAASAFKISWQCSACASVHTRCIILRTEIPLTLTAASTLTSVYSYIGYYFMQDVIESSLFFFNTVVTISV